MGAESFSVPFALALTLLCVTERSLNAFIGMFFFSTPWKKIASQQVLVKNVDLMASVASVFVTTFVRGVLYLFSWWIFFLVVFVFFGSLYVMYEENSEVVVGFVSFYNSSLGPWFSKVILAPLVLLDVIVKGLAPLYNTLVYWAKALFLDVLLPIIVDDLGILLKLGKVLLDFFGNLSISLKDFAVSFDCTGTSCLTPENHLVNCMTWMGNLRQFVALGVQLFGTFCGYLTSVVDLIVFPFMDYNFSSCIHNLVNSVTQLYFAIPHATYVRCNLAQNNTFKDLLCTPDAEPFFNYLVAAVSDLGLTIDNWLNVIIVILERFFTGSATTCNNLPNSLSPTTIMQGALFGSNMTRVVGLTQWMYAVTDGYLSVYTGHNDLDAKLQYWPYKIDPKFGVAAVVYADAADLDASSMSKGRTVGSLQTTAMLGCTCSDVVAGGIQIECAILPFSGVPGEKDPYYLQVLFPGEDVAYQIGTCSNIDISVHSSRFSLTRYETKTVSYGVSTVQATVPSADCVSRGTCREVDALVYLTPRCGQDSGVLCLPGAHCFPFCMAARVAGSANNNLVLVGADRWRSGYTLIDQDCALLEGDVQSTHANVFSSGTQTIVSSQPNILSLNSKTAITVGSQNKICKPAQRLASFVDKEVTPGLAVRLDGQPFVIAGETILTEKVLGKGFSVIVVERLTGDQKNVFTLQRLNQDLPAAPSLEVQRQEFLNEDPSHILIPFSTYAERMPAVTSRNYVFYASNPALDCFRAQFDYCYNRRNNLNDLPKIGFLLRSSYAPIRIYRVRAFTRCTAFSCGSDLVNFVQFQGFNDATFTPRCNQRFNASITSLEYVNEDNIAVVLHYTMEGEYDVDLQLGTGPNSGYHTYWLNPSTMQVKDSPWVILVESNFGVLCPALQRFPRVGTFASELLNSLIFSLRWVLNIFLYSPGLWKIWAAGGQCPAPQAALHHSILLNCGDTFMSLDDVFDSLDDAGAVFWHTLTLLAQSASKPVGNPDNPLSNLLQGMSAYGAATIDVWALGQSVVTFNKFPIKERLETFVDTISSTIGSRSAILSAAFRIQVGVITWARFIYKAVSTMVLTIIKASLNNQAMTEAQIWNAVWSTTYDLYPYYTSTVTQKSRMACAGIRTMFDISNPIALSIYYQCTAGAELADDIFKGLLTFVVDIPMVKCVCKDSPSSGSNIRRFVQDTCAPNIPATLRPMLYMMVNQIQSPTSGFRQLACEGVLSILKNDMQFTFDKTFQAEESMFSSLADSIDYLMIKFDDKSGQCLNYDGNPHVVVTMPQPSEYFAHCAKTSLCKAKCSSLWAAFQARVRTPVELPSIQVTTESFFFPGSLDTNMMLTNATAVTELTITTNCGSTDYTIAIAQYSGALLSSRTYCIPKNPGETIYPLQDSGFGPYSLPGSIISISYTNSTGLMLALLLRIGDENKVYTATSQGLTQYPSVQSRLSKTQKLVQTTNLWVIHNMILIDVVIRRFQDSVTVADELHYITNPASTIPVWSASSISLSQFADDYWYSYLPGYYLFLPKRAELSPYRLTFQLTGQFYALSSITPLSTPYWTNYVSTLSNHIMASHSANPSYIFAVTQQGWDWLKQVRLDGTGALNSVPITTTLLITGNCDELSCEGCPDALTQRLCLAYNKCALMKCVGTPLNMKRPLCGMGGLVKHYGELQIRTLSAAWTMIVEVIYTIVELSSIKKAGLNVAFPDDEFLGYMCTAKDGNANLMSIITSTLNSLLQLGQAKITYMYHGATNVDNNADAMLTVTMTAVTGFLHQSFLYPVYYLAAMRQILMCKINGILSLIDQTGFVIRLQSAELVNASAAITGKCLTLSDMNQARYPNQNKQAIGYQVSTFLQNAMQVAMFAKIEPYIHLLDAFMAYFQGWFRSVAILIMAQNMAQCNPPEHLLKDIATCACGDTPLTISNKQESFLDYAHWCSGTLGMVDGVNNPFVIFNPYSYQELQFAASGMQDYLDCASSSYKCTPPTLPEFDFQGVTLLNVLIKCRENYAKKQWDPMAYVLYDKSKWGLFKTRIPLTFSPSDPYGIKSCLVQNPASNQFCLELYLNNSQDAYDTYFAYRRAPTESRPEYLDACLTFSGPHKANASEFSNCVDGVNENQCLIPAHLWSPDSPNTVPVAHEHVVTYTGSQPDSLIYLLYHRAQNLVFTALEQAESVWMKTLQNQVDYEFFSAEGDIVHQILDCIFLGPYAKMDYWPNPPCEDQLDCPVGPYYSRDDPGLSRSIDSPACVNTTSLPYTCGSPSRKALVKYFVREYLTTANRGNTNGSILQEAVRNQLRELRTTWSAQANYGCRCADATHSHSCCVTANDTMLLPAKLNQAYQELKSDHVLTALTSQFDDFYNHILQSQLPWAKYLEDVAPGHQSLYDWSDSSRAVDEARYNPKIATVTYGGDEVISPLKQNVPHTLWDVCHAALKQVFWTVPLDSDGRLSIETVTNSVTEPLKILIREEANKYSPLHRHYMARYIPSDSLVCSHDLATPQAGSVSFADYRHQTSSGTATLLGGGELGQIPVFHKDRFALGSPECFCGWRRWPHGMCEAPPQGCDAVKEITGHTDCLYPPDLEPLVVDAYLEGVWDCPEMDLSAHWGVLDVDAQDRWMQDLPITTTESRDVLRYGRAGLRVGNVDTLKKEAKLAINPKYRELNRSEHGHLKCGPPILGTDLAQKFVDDLYPMAQGVEESGAGAYCLRMSVEEARLYALEMFVGGDSLEATKQREQVDLWRKRCGSQLQLLQLCSSLDVFFRQPDNLFSRCEHFTFVPGALYVTPECLVAYQDAFYDPCRCMDCDGNRTVSVDLSYLVNNPSCKLRFDPRELVKDGPIGWWGDVSEDKAYDNFKKDPTNYLVDNFEQLLLKEGDNFGNVEDGNAWWSAEGFMAENSEYCDMISDYWPDEWDYPLGYHVTTPCDTGDTAYRSFHKAFALEYEGERAVLRYQHDTLRDADKVDSYFGEAGLCRTTMLGMPLTNTNTMRYATRVPLDLTEDYTVAKTGNIPATAWTDWAVSGSSTELPWPDYTQNTEDQSSATHSIGLLPNMPPIGAETYPHTLDMWDVGPAQELNGEYPWGDKCSDYVLSTCVGDSQCPLGYTCRGRVCAGSDSVSCTSHSYCAGLNYGKCEGVCIDTANVQCIKHSDCLPGLMCSGIGTCLPLRISVQNMADLQNYTFQTYTKSQTCGAKSQSFSLLGGSYWGYVTNDVLRAHGLCSYADWYKHTQMFSTCTLTETPTYFELNPLTCKLQDLDSIDRDSTLWWNPQSARPDMMYVHPTNCDRDYERLSGFQACAPQKLDNNLRNTQTGRFSQVQYEQYVRTTTPDKKVRLAKMPLRSDAKYGYIGLSSVTTDTQFNSLNFAACSSIKQCFPLDFTHQRAKVTRMRTGTVASTSIAYNHDHTFQCGAIGYISNQQCVLDQDVLPLYKFLCVEPDSARTACSSTVFPSRALLCSGVTNSYPAGFTYVQDNVEALRAMFYAFATPTTTTQYLYMTKCMLSFYTYLQNRPLYRSLYYPFEFSLFEIPFDWFFQCFAMSDTKINHISRAPQDCLAYQRKDIYTKDNYEPTSTTGEDPMTFLRYVRGGYSLTDVEVYDIQSRTLTNARIDQAVNEAIRDLYASNDTSYPRCSTQVKWKIGPGYLYVSPYRAIIQTYYDTGSCHLQWLESLIALQPGLTSFSWFEALSEPDPDARLPQTYGGDTLLETVRDYMKTKIGVSPAAIILGSKTMDDPPALATRREAFVFSTELPSEPDEALFTQASDFSLPLPQPEDAESIVTFDSLTVPHICAFDDPYDDPLQTGMNYAPGQCSTKQRRRDGAKFSDNLRQCGAVWCSEVPAYYKVKGMYGCGYYPDVLGVTCTESTVSNLDINGNTCNNQLLTRLYQDVLARYSAPTISSLPVQSFPWFAANAAWTGFRFELGAILDHLGNIMPDKEKSIMCQIGSTKLDLMACNNPNYVALQSHVMSNYFHDGFPVIPSNQQLEWDLDSAVLTQGSIFAFASTDRDPSQTYLKNLFADSTTCKGNTTDNLRVCWQTGLTWNTMNPWHLGYWNPYEKCDVRYNSRSQGGDEVYSTQCLPCLDSDAYYTNMPNLATCKANNRKKVQFTGVPTTDEFGYLPYNLCHHTLKQDEGGCIHDQSLLGGFDGLNVGGDPALSKMTESTQYSEAGYKVSPNMYEPSEWEIPLDFQTGLFGATNPLFEGRDAPYGYLRSPDTELGVHHLQFLLNYDGNFTTFTLHKIPLHPKFRGDDVLSLQGSLPITDWTPTIQSKLREENLAHLKLYAIQYQNDLSASCPLKRFSFYGSSHPTFNPAMPSPLRARHLFKTINGDTLAHPIMSSTLTGEHLGSYTTHNGFCFCPKISGVKQPQCLKNIFGDQSECSLKNTVLLLKGLEGVIGTSVVHRPRDTNLADQTCTMMMDWPNLPNQLRDGSTSDINWGAASDVEGKKCHVLDRLRPFQYRYLSVPSFPKLSTITNACDTKRVSTIGFKPPNTRCVTSSRTSTETSLRCEDTQFQHVWQRRTILTPSETVTKRNFKRRLCSRCSLPPLFKSEKGAPIRAESSFGRHYRHSAERVLASDLKETLCSALGTCPILNESAWRPGEFMRAYLTNPKSLFASPKNYTRRQAKTSDDSILWQKPWAYCPDLDALKSGDCVGKISKAQWTKGKTVICPALIKQLSKADGEDPMSKTSFCKLDNTTDNLCKAITQARQIIMEANCIARGKNVSCLPQPWVYSPANFDPTNQEWNYKTVLNFYRDINSTVCPYTTQEKELISANRAFQRSCPANTLVLFEAVIKVLRILVHKLALLFTAVLSIFGRMCVLLIATANPFWSSTVKTAKADIAADWAWVKKEASQMIDSISDLLADALFSSGELGRGLVAFLDALCFGLNEIFDWLLKQWCEHLQPGLAKFLTVVRKGFGIVASGFEILQDFMDEMLAGVLPMSFMAKYGDKMFQKRMTEKYSQPSTKNKALGAVDSAEKAAQRASKQAGRLKMAGKAAGILSLALIAFDAYQIIQGSLLYPDNFTLFDFTEIFDNIDGFLEFLINERTCYERQIRQKYNLKKTMITCLNTRMSSVDPSNAEAMSVDATPCWAQASPSLGQSTLFSCNTGSTCCKDSSCTEFVLCDTCPSAQFEGVTRYGCNSLTQKCQCLVDQSRYSQCLRNQECGSSWCVLMTSLDGISYGTLPCSQCPGGNTFCMITSTGPGRCTCLMDQGGTRALCAERSGVKTISDGSKLCGYARDATENDAAFSYEYESIAMVSCIQALTVVCSVVYYPDNSYVRMSVAIPPVRFVDYRGRRLLGIEPPKQNDALLWPNWNNTASPCRELVMLYQSQNHTFGILEQLALDKCKYWREAGRAVLTSMNLTSLKDYDTMFLSVEDFASALSSKDNFLTIISNPWMFYKIALYHPWLKPVKSVFVLMETTLDQMASKLRQEDDWVDEVTKELPDDSYLERRRNRTKTGNNTAKKRRYLPNTSQYHHKTSRKLLSLKDEIQAIQGLIASAGDVARDVPSVEQVSEAYSRGPFHWPPYQRAPSDCVFGVKLVKVTVEVFTIMGQYYVNWDKPRKPIDRSFRNALPKINWNSSIIKTTNNVTKRSSWSSYLFHGLLSLTGSTPSDTLVFFKGTEPWTLRWLWHSFTRCDLSAVQSCSGHKRDLVMSIFVFILLYLAIVAIANAIGLPYLSFYFVLTSPILIVWYAYGVGPACFPLIPTCLIEDLIFTGRKILPGVIYFPKKLLCNQNHFNMSFIPESEACLKSCSTLGFTGWTEPLTFALCDLDQAWCASLANYSSPSQYLNSGFGPFLSPFRDSLLKFHPVISTPDVDAYRVCAWVTGVTAVPFAAILVTVTLLLGSLVLGFVQLGPVFFSLVAQSVAYHRTS